MKKIFLISGVFMLLLILLVISCKDDSDNIPDLPPAISFVPGENFVSNDTTLTSGSEFVVRINAQENATSGANIQSLIITRVSNGHVQDTETIYCDSATFIYEASFVALPDTGVEQIEFKVSDKAGQSAMIDLRITTKVVSPPAEPSISFIAGPGLISSDSTLSVNALFNIRILAEANPVSGAKLKSLKITRIFNLQTYDTTFSFNDEILSIEIYLIAQAIPGVETLEFEVTDKAGQSAMIDLQITTETAAGGEIDNWAMRILGSWNNLDTGCSFATINGNVYMLNEAFANQALIDFFYWWGASTDATIGAPDDANAAMVYNTGTYALQNWTIKNPTRFKTTTLSPTDFNAIPDAESIIDIATGADQTRIGNLLMDQVVAIITVTGKHGLICVKSITEGSSGSITIDVKVEK
jgi:hypothetical protein